MPGYGFYDVNNSSCNIKLRWTNERQGKIKFGIAWQPQVGTIRKPSLLSAIAPDPHYIYAPPLTVIKLPSHTEMEQIKLITTHKIPRKIKWPLQPKLKNKQRTEIKCTFENLQRIWKWKWKQTFKIGFRNQMTSADTFRNSPPCISFPTHVGARRVRATLHYNLRLLWRNQALGTYAKLRKQ